MSRAYDIIVLDSTIPGTDVSSVRRHREIYHDDFDVEFTMITLKSHDVNIMIVTASLT